MTPAIRQLQRARATHRVLRYEHDPDAPSFGLEAAEALGLPPAQVFKTLVVELASADGRERFAVAVVPVCRQLDLKAIAQASGAKRAAMAAVADAERVTGYVVGGISPFGQKRRLPVYVDASAGRFGEIYVSAGKRGLDIGVSPMLLEDMIDATLAPIAAPTAGGDE